MDIINRLCIIFRRYRVSVNESISTFFFNKSCQLKGVKIGKDISCFGLPYIFRNANSQISIGDNVQIRSDHNSNLMGINMRSIISTFRENATIKIGNNVGMSGVSIGCAKSIIIEDNCLIGANTLITDCDWHPINPNERLQHSKAEAVEVLIGKNVFIGTRTIILKGVNIGDNSVVGAGSVVTSNIPANVIAAGNPCKVIRTLS